MYCPICGGQNIDLIECSLISNVNVNYNGGEYRCNDCGSYVEIRFDPIWLSIVENEKRNK